MLNGSSSIDQALREAIARKQGELSGGWVSFPFDCICTKCGYDFTEDKSSLDTLVSGCPKCKRSFCE